MSRCPGKGYKPEAKAIYSVRSKEEEGKVEKQDKQGNCYSVSAKVEFLEESSGKNLSDPQKCFEPFQFDGYVSASEQSAVVKVRIMRDTASNHSIIVRNTFPKVECLMTGEKVILSGAWGYVLVSLC